MLSKQLKQNYYIGLPGSDGEPGIPGPQGIKGERG